MLKQNSSWARAEHLRREGVACPVQKLVSRDGEILDEIVAYITAPPGWARLHAELSPVPMIVEAEPIVAFAVGRLAMWPATLFQSAEEIAESVDRALLRPDGLVEEFDHIFPSVDAWLAHAAARDLV